MHVPVGGLEEYALVEDAGSRAFCLPEALPWLEGVLEAGQALHAWAHRHPDGRDLGGRGNARSVPAAFGGGGRWVIRHYLRGGAVARWLTDRYLALGEPRPFREARRSAEARRRGVPTPRVVAGATYRAGAFYRADLVTDEIPHGVDLARLLVSPAPPDRGEAVLAAAGTLVRTLERNGLLHPDVHAGNVVIQDLEGSVRAHLVDLDRCRLRPAGVPAPGHSMRRRLERSLRKLERRSGAALPPSAWAALRGGFASP